MSTTTSTALGNFARGYARMLHFYVSIAAKSLYDHLDELFQRKPELWSNETWLFDVQDIFIDHYGDPSVMNGLWEEWTEDYDRRLARLKDLPFREKELVLQKLSALCTRTPQTIDDILRLKARSHYAIKIITRTLLPVLSEDICIMLVIERERLRGTRVEMERLPLPPTQGVLLWPRRNQVLKLFSQEINAMETLDLDMTKRIFPIAQQVKAAMAERAQIFPFGHPPRVDRTNKTYTRIPASAFRADDERISRPIPPRSAAHPSSTPSSSTSRQPPTMGVVSASSQTVRPRAGTAPLLPNPKPMASKAKSVTKQFSGHPQPSASQPVDNGRKSAPSAWRATTRTGLTAQASSRLSSAASVRTPLRQVLEVDREDNNSTQTSKSTTSHPAHFPRTSPRKSQMSLVLQNRDTAASSRSSSRTNQLPLVAAPRSPLVDANREVVTDRHARPDPSYGQTPARARTTPVHRKDIAEIARASRSPPSVPDDEEREAIIQSLRQARLDPAECILRDPTSIICNKDNKHICFIHRNGTDTTIIRVNAIRTEADPTIPQALAIGGPYFDIVWFLNDRLLRILLEESVHDNLPDVIERYQARVIARDGVETFRLLDQTGVLNGEYSVQQGQSSPENFYYNVWMTVSRDRLTEYVAGFELAQKPDDL